MDIGVLLAINALGWIHLAKPSLLDTAATFTCMFVFFEFWFYFTHRLYHRKEFYFVHAQHHLSQVTSAWTAFSFSILERSSLNLGAFGFAIIYSHLLPFSVVGFFLYCLCSNLLNVLLHSNIEMFPAGFAKIPYLNWIFTPTFHALHHARFKQHYGLFTTIPDRMFNTLWPDYAQVQDRAARGKGLTSFREKISPEEAETKIDLGQELPSPNLDAAATVPVAS